NVGLIILVAAVAVAALLRVAGTAAAYITGIAPPTSGFAAGIRVLLSPGNPGSALDAPGLNPLLYWAVVGVLLTCLGAAAGAVWRLSRRETTRVSHDPHRLVGTATRRDVAKVASTRALLARSRALRPSLNKPAPSDVGYLLGS